MFKAIAQGEGVKVARAVVCVREHPLGTHRRPEAVKGSCERVLGNTGRQSLTHQNVTLAFA
jgi:propanediol dehydratase small subunit